MSPSTQHSPIDFSHRPDGVVPLPDEPVFDPAVHLALEKPGEIISLTEFGYSAEEVNSCPSDFAATDIFRILSDEGAACLMEVCNQLEAFTTSNPRIQRNMRGGVYRSAFLRDLCISKDVAEFVSEICGVELIPHTIPHQLGHLNYAPEQVGENVDKWHVDTLRYDYVMFVTDPKKNQGGAFQYYRGTKHEVAECHQSGKPLDPAKIISPEMPGPGYAIMQQGNMVVHQAKGLTAPGERITMVNGYIPQDPHFPDFTRYDQLRFADAEEVVTAEYSRHMAIKGQRMLDDVFGKDGFSSNRFGYADRLEAVAAMLQGAAREIRESNSETLEHFGD